MSEWKKVKLKQLLEEYCERNIEQKYKAVAVGKYGIRKREDIYSKELSKDISKNKVIIKDTLTIGMGSNQIDIGILTRDEKFCVSPAYTTYKIKNCNSKFLEYYLEYINPKISDLFMIISARQGKNVDKDGLMNYKIDIPKLKEQEKIVDILIKNDNIIHKYEKLIEEKNKFIKSIFANMYYNKNYSISKINDIAEKIFAGGDKPKDVSKEKNGEYKYPVFANGYENQGLQCYSKEFKVDQDAVTVSARGTIGNATVRKKKFTPIVRLITIIPNEKINIIYLKYAIEQINLASSGTSQSQLTVPSLKSENIVVPPIRIQKQFAEIVEKVDKQKFLLETQKENYINLKKALMQQLLTGKVKVKI